MTKKHDNNNGKPTDGAPDDAQAMAAEIDQLRAEIVRLKSRPPEVVEKTILPGDLEKRFDQLKQRERTFERQQIDRAVRAQLAPILAEYGYNPERDEHRAKVDAIVSKYTDPAAVEYSFQMKPNGKLVTGDKHGHGGDAYPDGMAQFVDIDRLTREAVEQYFEKPKQTPTASRRLKEAFEIGADTPRGQLLNRLAIIDQYADKIEANGWPRTNTPYYLAMEQRRKEVLNADLNNPAVFRRMSKRVAEIVDGCRNMIERDRWEYFYKTKDEATRQNMRPEKMTADDIRDGLATELERRGIDPRNASGQLGDILNGET